MNYYKVSEFANKSGLTVRALRYYDEIGLLKPCDTTQKGYRLYSDEQLIIVQQILTLKFLDFSIEDIKEIMINKEFNIKESLRIQKEILDSKITQLKLIRDAIGEVYAMEDDKLDWKVFLNIVDQLKEDKHVEWVEKYNNKYNPDIMKRIEENHEMILTAASTIIRVLNTKDDNALERAMSKWVEVTNNVAKGDSGVVLELDKMLRDFNLISSRQDTLSKKQLKILEFAIKKGRGL